MLYAYVFPSLTLAIQSIVLNINTLPISILILIATMLALLEFEPAISARKLIIFQDFTNVYLWFPELLMVYQEFDGFVFPWEKNLKVHITMWTSESQTLKIQFTTSEWRWGANGDLKEANAIQKCVFLNTFSS